MIYTALITVLALLVYMFFTAKVGAARVRFGVKAPATTGNADFERYYRVQMNTLEQLVVFLPALWLFSFVRTADGHELIPFGATHVGAALGAVWILGRILYARGYYRAAEKRHFGSMLSFISQLLLLLGALAGILINLPAVIHA